MRILITAVIITILGLAALPSPATAAIDCTGVCDQSDGWFHIVKAPRASLVNTAGGTFLVAPDPDGYVTFHQEVWVAPTNGGIYRMPIDSAARGHVWPTLAFNTAREGALALVGGGDPTEDGLAKTFSTGNTPGIERLVLHYPGSVDSGATIVWRIPLSVFEAEGMVAITGNNVVLHPSAVWSNLVYKPRYEGLPGDNGPGNGYSFGAGTSRTDHPGADVTNCRNANTVDAALRWCPESGGFMSHAKNLLMPANDAPNADAAAVERARQADTLEYGMTPFAALG